MPRFTVGPLAQLELEGKVSGHSVHDLNEAYSSGRSAGLLKLHSNQNPYTAMLNETWSLRDIWFMGWNDARL